MRCATHLVTMWAAQHTGAPKGLCGAPLAAAGRPRPLFRPYNLEGCTSHATDLGAGQHTEGEQMNNIVQLLMLIRYNGYNRKTLPENP